MMRLERAPCHNRTLPVGRFIPLLVLLSVCCLATGAQPAMAQQSAILQELLTEEECEKTITELNTIVDGVWFNVYLLSLIDEGLKEKAEQLKAALQGVETSGIVNQEELQTRLTATLQCVKAMKEIRDKIKKRIAELGGAGPVAPEPEEARRARQRVALIPDNTQKLDELRAALDALIGEKK